MPSPFSPRSGHFLKNHRTSYRVNHVLQKFPLPLLHSAYKYCRILSRDSTSGTSHHPNHSQGIRFEYSLLQDETWANHQKCTGVWGTMNVYPESTSAIMFNISIPDSSDQGVVSVVMFELGDEHLGGITVRNEDGSIRVCSRLM